MKKFWLFIATLLAITSMQQQVFADGGAGFNVSQVANENQLDQTVPYFDLRLNPDQQTELTISINNVSDETDTYDIELANAMTDKNMSYNYTAKNNQELTVPKELQLKNIAKLPEKQVTIAGNSSKVVTIPVTMPTNSFQGKLFGAIIVTRHTRLDEQRKNKITNKFAYIRAVVISESDEEIQPNVTFGAPTTHEADGLVNLEVPMALTTPTILTTITTHVVVSDTDGKVVMDTKESNHNIAPQSKFNYTVNLDSKKVPAGKYQLALTVSDQKGRKWTLNKAFNVSKKTVATADETPKIEPKVYHFNPWYIILGLALLVLVLLTLIFVLIRKRK